MLQLSQIWIYPIKSLQGILLEQSRLSPAGLEHDRRWMLVDDAGVFLSQRTHPQLALFCTKIEDGKLVIGHTDRSKGSVSFLLSQNRSSARITVEVWEEKVKAEEVSAEISAWFGQILGFSVRLVFMPEESYRKVAPDFALTPDDVTTFTDGFPFLIIGQSSLDDLNARLEHPVRMQRFRPNFVFTGGTAYEEEKWRDFSIGDVLFGGVKPCKRCVMTTVDPEKGVFSGNEPLLTLSKYKMVDHKVIFGQNGIAKQPGMVAVGDEICLDQK